MRFLRFVVPVVVALGITATVNYKQLTHDNPFLHSHHSVMAGIGQVVTPVTLHADGLPAASCDEVFIDLQQAAAVDANVYIITVLDLGPVMYNVELYRFVVNTTGGPVTVDCFGSWY